MTLPASIDSVQTMLGEAGYVCGRALATVVFLSLKLGRPLFLEGEAGVGKTEIAKALAQSLDRRMRALMRPARFMNGTSRRRWWPYAPPKPQVARIARACNQSCSAKTTLSNARFWKPCALMSVARLSC